MISIGQGPMRGRGVGPMDPVRGGLIGSFKKGGKVKKTGAYKLHKGEKVSPAKKHSR